MQHLRIPILAALALSLATPAQAKRLNKEEKETVAVDRELVAVMQTRDRGELTEAIDQLRTILAAHPDSLPAHLLYQEIAAVSRRNGGWVEAEYRHLLGEEPDDPGRMVLHAAATLTAGLTTPGYFSMDRIRGLERQLAAAEISEDAASYAHLVYAEVEQIRDRDKEVLGRLQSAVDADPLNFAARSELLIARMKGRETEEATQECLAMVEVAPWRVSHCRSLFPVDMDDELIGTAEQRERILAAVEDVQGKTKDPVVLESLRVFWSVADGARAEQLAEQLAGSGWSEPLRRNPYLEPLDGGELSPEELAGIERILEVVEANDNPKARAATLKAIGSEMPDSPRVQAHHQRMLAMALRGEGVEDKDGSRAALARAVELQPDDPSLLNEWAYMSALDKVDLAKALDASERALELLLGRPFDPIQIEPMEGYDDWSSAVAESVGAYVDTRGWVLYQLGRYEESVQALQLASTLTLDGTVEGHLGRARYALGQDEGAFLHLLRGLALGTEDEDEVRKLAAHIYSKTRVVPGGLDLLIEDTHRQILNQLGGEGTARPTSARPEPKGARYGSDSKHRLMGEEAPELRLTRIDGSALALSELRGRVVVVDFWATWCGPCRESLPVFDSLSQAFEGQDITFVMASVDDTLEEVQDFWSGLDMPVEVGLVQRSGADDYGVQGIPAMFIIGRDGTVVGHHVGAPEDVDVLAATLAELVTK